MTDFITTSLFTMCFAIIGYFINRHFVQFDEFKKEYRADKKEMSREIADIKLKVSGGVDHLARRKIEELHEENQSKILELKKYVANKIAEEKDLNKDLRNEQTQVIRDLKLLAGKLKNKNHGS